MKQKFEKNPSQARQLYEFLNEQNHPKNISIDESNEKQIVKRKRTKIHEKRNGFTCVQNNHKHDEDDVVFMSEEDEFIAQREKPTHKNTNHEKDDLFSKTLCKRKSKKNFQKSNDEDEEYILPSNDEDEEYILPLTEIKEEEIFENENNMNGHLTDITSNLLNPKDVKVNMTGCLTYEGKKLDFIVRSISKTKTCDKHFIFYPDKNTKQADWLDLDLNNFVWKSNEGKTFREGKILNVKFPTTQAEETSTEDLTMVMSSFRDSFLGISSKNNFKL